MRGNVQAPVLAKPKIPIYQEESNLRLKRRKLADRWVRWVVAAGGFAIIFSILAIFFFIGIEVLPLFQPAKVEKVESFPATKILQGSGADNGNPIAVGLEENQEIGYLISQHGSIQFFSLADGFLPRERFVLEGIQGERITSLWQSFNGTKLAVGTNQGNVLEFDIKFNPRFLRGLRSYQPVISENLVVHMDSDERATLTKLSFAGSSDENFGVAAKTEDGKVLVFVQSKKENLFGDVEIASKSFELDKKLSGRALSIALDDGIRNLYVGTNDGKIYHWNVNIDSEPEFVGVTRTTNKDGAGITALEFLIGDRTLLVGDAQGDVGAYTLVRDSTATNGWRLTRIHDMQSHPAAVTAFAPSARGKGFLSGDKQGNVLLQYTTSERTLAEFSNENGSEIQFINFTPKANGAVTLDSKSNLTYWKIDNPHPEASWQAFFGKVWYEGYDKPEYVWQSTGGSDDFESKLSLVPLIYGSLKGTFYTLILAMPLAIFAALYTSQFMHPTFRNYVKPMVEIMAALPSVVLGFLAGLWLAPIINGVVPGIFSMFIVLPLLILLSTFFWRTVPQRIRGRFHPGIEVALLIPIIVLGVWLCLESSALTEKLLFEGSFNQWIFDRFGYNYDQRNALVVGFAMGFAVIPIIYTISEDALSNVPRHLISGSLALGATRWQTAIRVVLPTAAAGIFSAVMIGFGRAVGETMIVLMATGNTPIMDWNIFNGFRTLSANIAVEIPEAPLGGTLYRVLFMAALLLFFATFMVNTIADVVRQRLREKYQKL